MNQGWNFACIFHMIVRRRLHFSIFNTGRISREIRRKWAVEYDLSGAKFRFFPDFSRCITDIEGGKAYIFLYWHLYYLCNFSASNSLRSCKNCAVQGSSVLRLQITAACVKVM